MPMTPSVAMNGGSLTMTISADVSSPDASADQHARRHRRTERPAGIDEQLAATTPASAITAPGARSMPPEMITIAAPTAAMP